MSYINEATLERLQAYQNRLRHCSLPQKGSLERQAHVVNSLFQVSRLHLQAAVLAVINAIKIALEQWCITALRGCHRVLYGNICIDLASCVRSGFSHRTQCRQARDSIYSLYSKLLSSTSRFCARQKPLMAYSAMILSSAGTVRVYSLMAPMPGSAVARSSVALTRWS